MADSSDSDEEHEQEVPRQPIKREGARDPEGQPIAKRTPPSASEESVPAEDQDQPSTSHPPVPVPPPPPAEETIDESLGRIFAVIEEVMGQSMIGVADLLNRNEMALGNSVRTLREALRHHEGNMPQSLSDFATALGPYVAPPPAPVQTPSQQNASVAPPTLTPPRTPQELTDRSAMEILRQLGKIFEQLYSVIEAIGFGDRTEALRNSRSTVYVYRRGVRQAVSEHEEIIDNNSVAYKFAEVTLYLGELLQYTFRIASLDKLATNLERLSTKWKTDMENVIAKAAITSEFMSSTTEAEPTRTLQLLPRLVYPPLATPTERYRIVVPNGELNVYVPERLLGPPVGPSSSLVRGEETLLIRFGSTELVNGTIKSQVNYTINGIRFRFIECFDSNGWIPPPNDDTNIHVINNGRCLRTLEFDLSKFAPNSVMYRILEKREPDHPEVQIIVSGIHNNKSDQDPDPATTSTNTNDGERVEFIFLLPKHLSRKSVNDAGVRNNVLKIQFAK